METGVRSHQEVRGQRDADAYAHETTLPFVGRVVGRAYMSGKIKKLYKTSGKCERKQQYKEMIESALVPTPEEFSDNSKMTHNPSVSTKILMQENQSVNL